MGRYQPQIGDRFSWLGSEYGFNKTIEAQDELGFIYSYEGTRFDNIRLKPSQLANGYECWDRYEKDEVPPQYLEGRTHYAVFENDPCPRL